MTEEYHALVGQELDEQLSPETRTMFARLEETTVKLDALLAAVQALPKTQAKE